VCVSIPVTVVERNGVFGAVRRSFRLTKGRRLAIFAAFLVFFVVLMAVSAVVNLLFPLVAAALGQVAGVVGMVISTAVSLATGSLAAIAPAVAYHDLRAEKEGVDTATLVKVFG
jgi:membrane-anchored glycerophosphoryl diester phosphodiesterase (GDPDase)